MARYKVFKLDDSGMSENSTNFIECSYYKTTTLIKDDEVNFLMHNFYISSLAGEELVASFPCDWSVMKIDTKPISKNKN